MVSSNKQANVPISAHPAFPAIVAMWFATLLGIGSLIVPAAVFEQMLAISGMTEIVPATKAPLGFTARLVIAIAGTGFGVLAGLMLARKVAGTRTGPAGKGHSPQAKPPISALAELGAPILDRPVEDEGPAEPAAEQWAGDSRDGADQTEDLHSCEMPDGKPEVDAAPQTNRQNPPTGMSAEQLIRRPLDELGIVQLVERFALALQQRPASAVHEQRTAYTAGEPQDAEVHEEFSSLLNLRKTYADPRKSVELPENGDSGPSETVAAFPSPESDPGQRKFAVPVAVPALDRQAREPGTAADTERTLRAALEQLQKMSGVG